MTQEQAADLLGVGKSTISMWETGKRTPTRAKYEAMADVFNVDMNVLLGKQSKSTYYLNPETAGWPRKQPTIRKPGYCWTPNGIYLLRICSTLSVLSNI